MVLSNILLLYLAIVGMCWAGEPVCRQFDYDEKMLSKMIRTEIAVEAMVKRLEVLESMLKERDEKMQGPDIAEMIRSSSVDGGWTEWNGWTKCTSTCGVGIKSRYRVCDNPAPSLSGKVCEGSPVEFISCTLQPCQELKPIAEKIDGGVQDMAPRIGFTAKYPSALPNGGLAFKTVVTNYGKNFKASTGTFICEIPGLYFFSATIISGSSTSSPCNCWITVGSATKSLVYAHTKHTGDFPSGSGSLVYELKKDDKVSLRGCKNAEKFDSSTHFSGVLIKYK